MIEFKDVEKKYNKNNDVVKDVSFKINKGEFVFLVGQSGAGKSTILKMLYKAEKATKGQIKIFNKDIKKIRRTKLRKNVGIVFQDFEASLLKNKTAYENVAYVLESQGQNPFKVKQKAKSALEKMGVLDIMKHYPHELSGGEKQRVAIARAIVNNPDILICDEPTGNLDPENADIVMNYLNQLNREGSTIIMTTHNTHILEKEKKRTLVVADGIVQEKGVYSGKEEEIEFVKPTSGLSNLIVQK